MSVPDVLRRIIAHKRRELPEAMRRRPPGKVRAEAAGALPPRDFAGALRGDDVAIIAEIKRASPSEGAIREGFDPAAIAAAYDEAGAAALSVLTDEEFFRGRLDDLTRARAAADRPVLRKDFIIDEYHVHEARAAGADAILLIVAALESEELSALLELTRELGMRALVEAHDEAELRAAVEAGAGIVGVNNRDLRTFEVDLGVTERLARLVPADRLLVAESGVATRADVERLADAGADAALVGTALMRAASPGRALRELVGVEVDRSRRPAAPV